MLALLAAHWTIALPWLLYVLSDVMPFLPTKYKGVAHALLDVLKWAAANLKAPAAPAPPKDGAK